MSFDATARVAPEKAVFRPALPLVLLPGITEMRMTKLSFADQIKHPNWQRKRLEVLESAGWECENCGAEETTLNVHHKQYVKGRMYWEYERHELECLCEKCHKTHHEAQDGLKRLLAEINQHEAFGVIAGFHYASDWVDKANVHQARDGDALSFAAGFVAYLTHNLDIDDMRLVAAFAVSLSSARSESPMIFKSAGHLFGGE